MSIVYITEPGAKARIRDGRLLVTKGALILADEPLMKIEQVVLSGYAEATTPLIAHCMDRHIDIAYVSSAGAFRGRIQGPEHNDVSVRMAQYDRCREDGFRLSTARVIVAGKIANQGVLLRRRGEIKTATRLVGIARQTRSALDVSALLGSEGAASAAYFRALAALLPLHLAFKGHRTRPAQDAVNAVLNLGYTLLAKNITAVLSLAGLDPFLGCLHETRHGHAALASDLMEEWRPVIVDTILLTMASRRELSDDDFETSTSGMRFKRPALRRFLSRFEGRLEETAKYPLLNARFTYRQMMDLQARHFRRVIQGKEQAYQPFRWDW